MEEFLLHFETYLQGFFSVAPFSVSFIAGVLTFLLPCVLPMVPAYLSYISGLSLDELEENRGVNTRKIFVASLLFVFGFSIVFVSLGVLSDTILGYALRSSAVKILGGFVIVIFGLHIMQLVKIRFLNFAVQANFKSSGFFSPVVLGLSFAVGWSPCVGPILGSIFLLGTQENSKAAFLMATYALGLGIPFILTALLTVKAFSIMNKLKKHFKKFEIIAGILLLLIGVKFIYEGLTSLA